MIAELHTVGQILETGMLICFGISWPIDILKLVRSKRTEGKSLAFMTIIVIGYFFGVAAKISRTSGTGGWPEWVVWLYALNAVLVSVDIALYLRYRPKAQTMAAS